jgi:hypothetical protein
VRLPKKAPFPLVLTIRRVVISSIARLPYVIILRKTEDPSSTQAILGIWSIIEVNLGIICACAMRMKGLVMTYLPQMAAFFSRSVGGSQAWKSGGLRIDNSDREGLYELHSKRDASNKPSPMIAESIVRVRSRSGAR